MSNGESRNGIDFSLSVGIGGWLLAIWDRLVKLRFRVAPSVLWGVMLVGSVLIVMQPFTSQLGSAPALAVGLGLVIVSVAGLVNWWTLSHPKPVLAVCAFAAPEGMSDVATDANARVFAQVIDSIPSRLRVLDIKERVGAKDTRLAQGLLRRLGVPLLLYGDVRLDGRLEARLLRPVQRYVIHADEFTRDRVPQKTLWRTVVDRLDPSQEVDEVYVWVGRQLEGVVRGLEGQVLLTLGESRRAQQTLQDAIAIAGDAPTQFVDEMRIQLAEAMLDQGNPDGAARLIIDRAQADDASASLLRYAAQLLVSPPGSPPSHIRAMAIGFLRRASLFRADPRRDWTLYMLAKLLKEQEDTQEEGWDLFRNLVTFNGSHYYKAWYVIRELGVEQFHRYQQLNEEGRESEARQAAKAAARFYRQAIWRRPKRGLQRTGPRVWHVRVGPERSPIMVANLLDARRAAGGGAMAVITEWRLNRLRAQFIKKGLRYAKVGDWVGTYKYFEWIWVGRGDDPDLASRVACSVAAEQAGWEERAAEMWQEALLIEPHLGEEAREHIEDLLGVGSTNGASV